MFDSLQELSSKLAATGYFIDPVMTQVVFLAAKLQKPLLLEGPAGSGKTQLALSVAAAGGTHVERLQCYRGVSEDKAIGRFDEGLQRLYMEFSKGQKENWQTVQANLKGRDFFRPGPLMRALECERPCVLLIDELDKVDDGFEAMLLEILSAWQLSIPEFGTVAAKSISVQQGRPFRAVALWRVCLADVFGDVARARRLRPAYRSDKRRCLLDGDDESGKLDSQRHPAHVRLDSTRGHGAPHGRSCF